MNKVLITTISTLILIVIILSCTQKKNPVGFQGGVEPKEILIEFDKFGTSCSFEDSIKAYVGNSKLIIGKYSSNIREDNEAKILIRMINLPDSIFSFESVIELRLVIDNNYNFDNIDNETLKFGEMNQLWKENEATWFIPTDTTTWVQSDGFSEDDYELIEVENIEATEDTIYIELPETLINQWIESDSINFGLVIYSEEDNSFLEIYSSAPNSPILEFDYIRTEGDSVSSFSKGLTSDTFIYYTDYEYQQYNEKLIISNIQPVKMFMEFDISDSVFINADSSDIENNEDYRRMTINKAELFLSPTDENNYPFEGSIYLAPYIVTSDSVYFGDLSEPLINKDSYESLYDNTSGDSLTADEIVINITKIVQNITSGEYENNGILIKSIFENKDFIHVSYAAKDYVDISKRPKLKIIYTPPYLDE
jgi:hypothetical protein